MEKQENIAMFAFLKEVIEGIVDFITRSAASLTLFIEGFKKGETTFNPDALN